MVAQIQRLRTELDARRSERITMDLIEWLISLDDTKVDYGYLARYAAQVTSADTGAVLKKPEL